MIAENRNPSPPEPDEFFRRLAWNPPGDPDGRQLGGSLFDLPAPVYLQKPQELLQPVQVRTNMIYDSIESEPAQVDAG